MCLSTKPCIAVLQKMKGLRNCLNNSSLLLHVLAVLVLIRFGRGCNKQRFFVYHTKGWKGSLQSEMRMADSLEARTFVCFEGGTPLDSPPAFLDLKHVGKTMIVARQIGLSWGPSTQEVS